MNWDLGAIELYLCREDNEHRIRLVTSVELLTLDEARELIDALGSALDQADELDLEHVDGEF